jgi:hypothetical protein
VTPGPDPDDIVSKLDALVEPAPEAENAVLTDEARVVRWTGPVFAAFSMILLPWTIYLAQSLPVRQVSSHYDAAWAGFDVMLMVALASAGYFARCAGPVTSRRLRRPRRRCWSSVLGSMS